MKLKVTDLKLGIDEIAFAPHLICSIIIPLEPLQDGIKSGNMDEVYREIGKELCDGIKEVTPPMINEVMWPTPPADIK